ncbi:MAG: porin [Candidatus Brocadiaceae bacterium]|nr:porin [Candidatus Brocadiaceae bacterium]
MKKCILILSTIFASNSALANVESNKYQVVSDLNVKLGAYAAFEAGGSRQSHLKSSEKNLSANRDGFLFYNDTALFATISNKHEEVEYGGKIILVPTAQRKNIPSYNGSHIFIKSEFGHIELGSPIPVAQNMMISDGSVPGKYIKKTSSHLKQNKEHGPSFLTGDGHFLGDNIVADFDKAKYSKEPPRTINYYTPKFALGNTTKVQLGVSYTPDSSNTGAGGANEKTTSSATKKVGIDNLHKFEIDKSVADAVTAGIKLEQKISDDINLKLALTGEYGNTKGKAKKYISKDDKNPLEHKLANLRSYNIGGELKLSDFTFNACYGNLAKSFTTPEFHKSGTKSHYYNAGVAYKYGQTTTKLSYFGSEQYKNKVSSVKLNISHILAPGLKPYAEISSYTLKGKPEFHNDLKSKSTRGTVALLGLKLTL